MESSYIFGYAQNTPAHPGLDDGTHHQVDTMANQGNPRNTGLPFYDHDSMPSSQAYPQSNQWEQYEAHDPDGYSTGFQQQYTDGPEQRDVYDQRVVSGAFQQHSGPWNDRRPEETSQSTTHQQYDPQYGIADPALPEMNWTPHKQVPHSDCSSHSVSAVSVNRAQHLFTDMSYGAECNEPMLSEAVYEPSECQSYLDPMVSDVQYTQEFSQEAERWSGYSMDLDTSLAGPDRTESDEGYVVVDINEPPWSTVHKRQDQCLAKLDTDVAHIMHRMGASNGSGTSDMGDIAPSSSFATNVSASESSFNNDVQESMESSQATIKLIESCHRAGSNSASYPKPLLKGERKVPLPGEPSRFELVVRKSTPVSLGHETSQRQFAPPSNYLNGDPYLSIPERPRSISEPSSPTSSTTPEVIPCKHCNVEFTGEYRKGNLGRHIRAKHRGRVVTYTCEGDGCEQEFNRKDARLKHYRKHHKQLVSGPAKPRKHRSQPRSSDVASQQVHNPYGGSQSPHYFQNPPYESRDDLQAVGASTLPFREPEQRDQDLRGVFGTG